MWEISINASSENSCLAKFIYSSLFEVVESVGGVITSYEQCGKISVLVAVNEEERPRIEAFVLTTLANAVCTFFKEKFLSERLKLPRRPELELYAFKKALIFFDRETDRFLVSKFLVLTKTIEIESFFHFRLGALKEKWTELAAIANENSSYLLGDESFFELLKFLIDNIEVAFDEVLVKIEEGNIGVFDMAGNTLLSCSDFEKLVDFLMTNSPRRIVWHSKEPQPFLEKIFSKRIIYETPSWAKMCQKNCGEIE